MSHMDEKIAQIIAQYKPEEYDKAIAGAEEYEYFYHLSSLRSALLNWYPFDGEWDVLEINGGFGALTGVIAAKVTSVDTLEKDSLRAQAMRKRFCGRANIHVYEQNMADFAPGKKYDCIVSINALLSPDDDGPRAERENKAEALFSKCFELLKPGGLLLVGYRNRFGIRFMCGGTSYEQPRAFSALDEAENRMFSREQMNTCLKRAGFMNTAYYYPMPDELFAQVICTDDMPKRGTLSDRFFTCDPFGSPLIAEEKTLYDDLLREDMLHTMANYFLAAFVKPPVSDAPARKVTFAALSTDRGKDASYTTIVYSDGTVEKTALHMEGTLSLHRLSDALNELQKRQINIVPAVLGGGTLRMPFVEEEPLLDAIRRFAKADPEKVYQVFDQLRENAIRSSDIVQVTAPIEAFWGIPGTELGAVLKKGYIDMIPLNAFWTGSGIRYYDQEFSLENCPVNYIMYRAILYTWLHVAGLEERIPMARMRSRYGLDKTWHIFAAYEQKFVDENRNFELYGRLYRWSYTDIQKIQANRALLRSKKEEQDLIDEVHCVQLDLLKKLIEACDKLGLKYFAIHGTLLGAVRHQGFIPWDDDVDIAMPREDYEKLLSHAGEVFSEPYFLQSFENETSCFYGGYAKLRNSHTAAIEPQNRGRRCDQGIWIDILPVDHCPADDAGRRKLQKKITCLQELLLAKLYPLRSDVLSEVSDTKRCLYHLISRVLSRRWIYSWLHHVLLSVKKGSYLSILACYYRDWENKNVYRFEELESMIDMPFEDICIPVPCKWQDILIRRYGENYHQLPEESRRHTHKNIAFYTHQSWKEIQ